MDNNEYWERFFETGLIMDYLNYTACTSELADENIEDITGLKKEGGRFGRNWHDRNGSVGDARRRL